MKLAVSLLFATIAFAQQPAFEVASIKANGSGQQGAFSENFAPGGRFTGTNVTVWVLLRVAYGLRDLQLADGPSWIKSAGFDIEAKPAESVSPEQATRMLQTLLADRFHLKFHREMKPQTGYALKLASSPARLAPPREGPSNLRFGDFDAASQTLTSFCQTLEFELARPVANQTGLDGPYAIKLQWASERIPADASSGKPSLFTALQEQLGVKLESARVPVEMFIIDSIDRPTDN